MTYDTCETTCNHLKIAYDLFHKAGIEKNHLDGLNVWVGTSRRDTFSNEIKTLYECVLSKLGVKLLDCDINAILTSKVEYDALFMFTLTPGISARAIELAITSKLKHNIRTENLLIYMPSEYKDGYIDRKLEEFRVYHHTRDQYLEEDVFKQSLRTLINIANDKEKEMEITFEPEIFIVTALALEFDMMAKFLTDVRYDNSYGDDKKQYPHGKIGNKKVVLAMSGMGNNFSAAIAGGVLQKYPTIKYPIMTGIAGGVPQKTQLGDLVISDLNGVIQHDIGKTIEEYHINVFGFKLFKKAGFEHKAPPRPPQATIFRNAQILVNERKTSGFHFWEYLHNIGITNDENKKPNVHFGTIASGNSVIKNGKVRDDLVKQFDASAIEMEASGVADASWLNNKNIFIVRGICDYANKEKNKIWQPFAAAAAAAFTSELIEFIGTND